MAAPAPVRTRPEPECRSGDRRGLGRKLLGIPAVGGSVRDFLREVVISLWLSKQHRELKARLKLPRLAITDIFASPSFRVAAHLDHGQAAPVTKIEPMAANPLPASPLPASPAPAAGDTPRNDAIARRRAMREAREKARA